MASLYVNAASYLVSRSLQDTAFQVGSRNLPSHIDNVANYVVRRDLDAQPMPHEPVVEVEGSPIALFVVALTTIAFLFVIISIRYTLWGVVTTLACVEQPIPDYQAVDQGEASELGGQPVAKPITSRIRRTIGHLHAKGGWKSRWRGFAPYFIAMTLQSIISSLITGALTIIPWNVMYLLGQILGPVVSGVLLARIYTTWTHIVISEPSPKKWYQRLAPSYTMKNTWLPTAVACLAASMTVALPTQMIRGLGLTDPIRVGDMSPGVIFGKWLAVAVVAFTTFIFVSMPAQVALIRIQASMLPEEDESIVPFDRSYGGRVEPRIVGGSGALDMVSAWKSFDGPARTRILRLFAKIIGIEIALYVVFGLIIFAEIAILIGLGNVHEKVGMM